VRQCRRATKNERLSGSHVTAVMMRSVGDTVGPFIYMGSRRAFDRGWGRERPGERKREGGRTGGRSKAATRSWGASVLFLPCLSPPPARSPRRCTTSPPSRAEKREVEEPAGDARARVRLPRAIVSSLRNHPDAIAMTQSSHVAGPLRCRCFCRNRKCAIGRLSM
jgi:hypothetical protein